MHPLTRFEHRCYNSSRSIFRCCYALLKRIWDLGVSTIPTAFPTGPAVPYRDLVSVSSSSLARCATHPQNIVQKAQVNLKKLRMVGFKVQSSLRCHLRSLQHLHHGSCRCRLRRTNSAINYVVPLCEPCIFVCTTCMYLGRNRKLRCTLFWQSKTSCKVAL